MPAPINPYCPPAASGPRGGRVLNFLSEALKLSLAHLQAVTVPLQARLSNTTPVSDTYKVPGDMDLLVFGMVGYVLFPTLNSETTAILTYLNLDPSERIFVKAQNCLVKLENTDRQLKVTESRDVPLASITPPFGAPVQWPLEALLVAPGNNTLKATFALQDSTSAIVGNASDYGIRLDGVLVPHDLVNNLQK